MGTKLPDGWITLSNSRRVPVIEKERSETQGLDEKEQLERDVYQGRRYFLLLRRRLFNSICLCFAFQQLNSK